jgi:SAM-dependent methyltransferase
MDEDFQPIKNDPPTSLFLKFKFFLRLIFDFQTLTLYKDLRKFLKSKSGKILDIGCGNSPYKHLINRRSEYIGIDIAGQKDFKYNNYNISYFDGENIPMPNESVNLILCTEVLEHIATPEKIIKEMHRVLENDGSALISIPWSARFHYIPYDYYRYTPSSLEKLFKDFKSVKIKPRGSDITVICSKLIVASARTLKPKKNANLILLPIWAVILLPIVLLSLIIGHLSIIFNFGSKNDPLGYTIYLSKK